MNRRMRMLFGLLLLGLALAAVAPAAEPASAKITAIDRSTGMVAARVRDGRTIEFKVEDARVLKRLKVGQKISADLAAMTVTLPARRPGAQAVQVRILKAEPVGAVGSPVRRAPSAPPTPATPPPDEPDEVDEPDEPDAKVELRSGSHPLASAAAVAGGTRLRDYPQAQQLLNQLSQFMVEKEIDVALLGGQKYMINKCLGVKASAGKFKLKLASPNFRVEQTGVVATFRIPRVSFSALKIRIRPNVTNPLKPCKFSKKRTVGGSARDLVYEMRFDPILHLQQCKLGSLGNVHHKWRIGNLNLKPLQNDLDKVAKNMIEDSLTYVSNFNIMDRIVAGINGFLGAQCRR